MPESSTYGVSAVRGSLRIQIENREILVPFTAIPKNDDNRTVMALKFLSDSIRSHGKRKFQPRTPLHEALYTYLRALPFHHFVGEYKDIIDKARRSEEHTSELQSLMRISYAVFCLKKTTKKRN